LASVLADHFAVSAVERVTAAVGAVCTGFVGGVPSTVRCTVAVRCCVSSLSAWTV
jgi:hypothetical protein